MAYHSLLWCIDRHSSSDWSSQLGYYMARRYRCRELLYTASYSIIFRSSSYNWFNIHWNYSIRKVERNRRKKRKRKRKRKRTCTATAGRQTKRTHDEQGIIINRFRRCNTKFALFIFIIDFTSSFDTNFVQNAISYQACCYWLYY